MKRDEKNALSRRRILEAAMQEFAARGYEGASLTAACAQHGISKGVIYHHFRDKDDLYLLCVGDCFTQLTAHLAEATRTFTGTSEERLQAYFEARLRFFAAHPLYLGLFVDAALNPPAHLREEIAKVRKAFDALNAAVLEAMIRTAPLRGGVQPTAVVEDFRLYLDFFNLRFRTELQNSSSAEEALQKHEERSRRQLDILLHGILREENEAFRN